MKRMENVYDVAKGLLTRFAVDGSRLDQAGSLAAKIAALIALYLVAAWLMSLWASRSQNRFVSAIADAMTPRVLAVLMAGLVATASPAAAQSSPRASNNGHSEAASKAPVMRVLGDSEVDDQSPPVMRQVEEASQPGDERDTGDERDAGVARDAGSKPDADDGRAAGEGPDADVGPAAQVAPHADGDRAAGNGPDGAVHVVKAGDHFWSIAESALVATGVTNPSIDQISRYWSALVKANSERLIDPKNPDLIMPGQELVMPRVDQLSD